MYSSCNLPSIFRIIAQCRFNRVNRKPKKRVAMSPAIFFFRRLNYILHVHDSPTHLVCIPVFLPYTYLNILM